MRYGSKWMVVGLTALITGIPPVCAQTPPDQIRDWPGLTYLGVVGGLEAWSVDGSDALWMRAPDGRALIRGEMFSAAGRNLGAALTGAEPSPLLEDPAAGGPDWSAPTPDLVSAVIGLSRTEAFSLLVGEAEAPEVWVWADLADPATSAAYMMLRDRIEAGALALRVIPVVTSDPASSELMLRAMSQAGPIGALEGLVRGGRLPADAAIDEEALARGEGLISRIERNGALARQISPPGLPFLLWMREEGPALFRGVPTPDLFESVLRQTAPDGEAGPEAPAGD